MRSLFFLTFFIWMLADTPVRGDFTFYGVKFPSRGPKSTGVVRTAVPDFPWRSAGRVRTLEDLDRLVGKGRRPDRKGTSSFRPAIFYVSGQSARADESNLARHQYFYFLQKDVKERIDQYRWYWIHAHSTLGSFLLNRLRLSGTALIIFDRDGSVLHAESPINSPQSVARAMRMIKYKRQMEAAMEADIPRLESELEEGNIKSLLKYLERAHRYSMYASERTAARLASLRERLRRQGEERIKKAEELARGGERRDALEILRGVRRDFQGHPVAKRADNMAAKIRKRGS